VGIKIHRNGHALSARLVGGRARPFHGRLLRGPDFLLAVSGSLGDVTVDVVAGLPAPEQLLRLVRQGGVLEPANGRGRIEAKVVTTGGGDLYIFTEDLDRMLACRSVSRSTSRSLRSPRPAGRVAAACDRPGSPPSPRRRRVWRVLGQQGVPAQPRPRADPGRVPSSAGSRAAQSPDRSGAGKRHQVGQPDPASPPPRVTVEVVITERHAAHIFRTEGIPRRLTTRI